MLLNFDSYRINVKVIDNLLKDKTPKERIDNIGEIAIITCVPIVAVCQYVGELYGFTDELNALSNRLKLFYDITEVKGVR